MKEIIEKVIKDLVTKIHPLLKQDEVGYRVVPYYIVLNEVKELRIIFDGDQDFKVFSKDGSLSDTDCQILKSHMVLIVYPHLGRIGISTHYEDNGGEVRYDNDSLLWGGKESADGLSWFMTVGRLNELNRMLPEGVEAKLGHASPWGSQTEALMFYVERDNEEPEFLTRVWWDTSTGQWESGRPTRGTSYHYDTPEQFIREVILRGELDKPTEERIKILQGIFGDNVTIEPSGCEPLDQYFDGFIITAENGNTAVIWKYHDGSWGAWNKYPKISTSPTLKGIAEIMKDALLS